MAAVTGILLAAGKSARMRGRDKLMEDIGGLSLLRDRAAMLTQTDLASILVVLPPARPDRANALEGLPVQKIENPQAETGLSSSIRAGLGAVKTGHSGALIMPADMPNLQPSHIDEMLERHAALPDHIIRAVGASGRPSSPNLIPRRLFATFHTLEGDTGGRELLRQDGQIEPVALSGEYDPTLDLDTPESWDKWRAHRARLQQ